MTPEKKREIGVLITLLMGVATVISGSIKIIIHLISMQ